MAACSGTQVVNTTVAVTELALLTFVGANGSNATVAGLTATWTGNRTASAVAVKFANISNGGTGANGGGFTFTGSLTGWSSGAATGAQVTFTSATPNVNVADITVGGATPPSVSTTQGQAPNLALTNLLTGNTVCAAAGAGWRHQEFHQVGGNLIDWKKGASHPVDPTKSVGSWSITGTGAATRVNYTYGSTTYINTVWDHGGGSYSFCNTLGTEVLSTIKLGQGACP